MIDMEISNYFARLYNELSSMKLIALVFFGSTVSAFCEGKNEIKVKIVSFYEPDIEYRELRGYCPQVVYKNDRYQPFEDSILQGGRSVLFPLTQKCENIVSVKVYKNKECTLGDYTGTIIDGTESYDRQTNTLRVKLKGNYTIEKAYENFSKNPIEAL
jgi:hypothetical protein